MKVQCGNCGRDFNIPDQKISGSGSGVKFRCTKCGAQVVVTMEDFRTHQLFSGSDPLSASEDPPVDESPAAASPPPAPSFTASTSAPASDETSSDTIHPFVSGSLAGAFGGMGCAVLILLPMLLGIGAVAALTAGRAMMVVGTSLIGFGVLIGIVLAFYQAQTENTIFGLPGVLIGGLIGAVLGVLKGTIVALGSGAIFSIAIIIGGAIGWGLQGLFIALFVVLVRRAIMSQKKESTLATISGGQLLIVGLALLSVLLGTVGEIRSAFNLKGAKEATAKTFHDMAAAEGLQVTNAQSSWDPDTGDLILTATIENQGDKEKKIWYLVAQTKDASGNVLSTSRMLTGKQIYNQRDYEIMGKRGMDVKSLRIEQMRRKDTPLAAHATMDVELRVLEPPSNIASFDASFQPFDPVKILKEEMEEARKHQAERAAQPGQ